ncbi:imidazole glycerol phosphate synthase subunit HisH [Solilutibacter silvestris]|uniref:Imidazole glycerol phosphate synthase subunit HisH n=1 Tax=Solilutibacter silvestris TaxID=1645665 RepID=A0A2K1PZX4_9GAMM|nr:imidazole glycerol phosphate synthase subunit HisH [Lysobacter silvestris]PNS08356.1 imidazole glycerol phosphate synthase [Lysobacter silvestris]
MTRVALIDAGGANLGSVRDALERLGAQVTVIRDGDGLRDAERVMLPGVGAAAPGMRLLRERGFVEVLRASPVPLLGVCLGMQLLFESSEEGDVECLGLIPGRVFKLKEAPGVRVPHMGWNTFELVQGGSLVAGIDGSSTAYFVHSYAAPVTADCIAGCEHGQSFAAIVQHGNVCGAQFHPERSGVTGACLLSNFLDWTP